MPQIGYDPATGRLTLDGEVLDRNDPRMWGSVGRNVLDVSTGDQGAFGAEDYDPRYYEPYKEWTENGEVTRYRRKPEVSDQLGGRIQLGQSGVGGHAETIDPSKLQWSDEFGILTSRDNYSAPDPGNFLERNPWLLALPAAFGALSSGGAFGGGGASEGAAAANLAPGGPSGTAAFGTPGFGAGEGAGILPEAGSTPARFGTPGFGRGEMFFTDTMGLGGGGGALGTGTSLVGTGLGAGTVTGPLGSGFSLAGTGLAPGAVTGTGAVAGGAAAGGSMVRDALSLARDLLGGGEQGAGGGILGGFGAAPKIGEHRQDNDPYGLMASGYGPWTGIIPESADAKKAKITEAMMKRKPSVWG